MTGSASHPRTRGLNTLDMSLSQKQELVVNTRSLTKEEPGSA
jgi:hypothetical protein